jgi:hypothetical protein
MQRHDSEQNRALYPVNIASSELAGIPVRIVTPIDRIPVDKVDHVLINLHGGGFTTDSGSLTESIPIANLAHTGERDWISLRPIHLQFCCYRSFLLQLGAGKSAAPDEQTGARD